MGLDRISDIDLGRIATDLRRKYCKTVFLTLGKRTNDSNHSIGSAQHRLITAIINRDIPGNLLMSLEDNLSSPLETHGERNAGKDRAEEQLRTGRLCHGYLRHCTRSLDGRQYACQLLSRNRHSLKSRSHGKERSGAVGDGRRELGHHPGLCRIGESLHRRSVI